MNIDIIKAFTEKERLLFLMQQVAGLGTYVMDISSGQFTTSEVLDQIFGLPKDYPRTYEGWMGVIHPDDRRMISEYFSNDVLGMRKKFNKEYRIVRVLDGAERWILGYGDLDFDVDKNPVTMIGTVQDITERKCAERALQLSETRYRELVDLAVDGILVGSHEGVIIEANWCMCEMTGLRRDELVGKHIGLVLFTPESLASKPLRFDLLQKGETVVSERQILHADGSLAHIEMRTKMMPDGTYQSIYRDVTERKNAETSLLNFTKLLSQRVEERTKELEAANVTLKQNVLQLRTSQVLLNEMGCMGRVGGWELDIHTGKQVWTEEVYRIHEVDLDYEPTGEKGITFYVPAARPLIEEAVRRCIEQGEPFDFEFEFITAKGNSRWVRSIGKADLEHGRIYGTFQDVTDRRLASDALREKNVALDQSVVQLRKLAMELTQAEELERKRLAAILHDQVQQLIVAATMKISLLDSQGLADDHDRGVQEILGILQEALGASRSLTLSLCPPVLLEAGLLPGLQWLADWMKDKHGLSVKVAGTNPQAVPGPLCSLLFQAVRELLFNIVKHADVKKASISLSQPNARSLRLIIADKGKGFTQNEAQASNPSNGFGLFHLHERLTYIGGVLEVTSKPLKGTRITITVPL